MGKCHELYPCLKQVQHSFIEYKNYMYMTIYIYYSQTCLSDPLCITASFVSQPYLFLPSVFPYIRPLYNDPLSNAANDRVLWVKILHITTQFICQLYLLPKRKLRAQWLNFKTRKSVCCEKRQIGREQSNVWYKSFVVYFYIIL
jgi:hypothetical protein